MSERNLWLPLALALWGCSVESTPAPPTEPADPTCPPGAIELEDGSCQGAEQPTANCPAGELELPDGGCLRAGMLENGCEAGQFAADGSCVQPGLPPDWCTAGPDGGCEPLVPSCDVGEIALPGDPNCRPLTDCGTGTWGSIPVEPDTIYVDASYQPNDSDGSAAHPFVDIQAAVDAALDDEIIAIAAGTYTQDVQIFIKEVRLWGRCPQMVHLVGQTVSPTIVIVSFRAELRSMSVTGPGSAVAITGNSKGVLLDTMHLHDTGYGALQVAGHVNDAMVRNTLIEGSMEYGVFALGSIVDIEDTVIRDIVPDSNGQFGDGIILQPVSEDSVQYGVPSTLSLRNSLIERTHQSGIAAISSDAVVDRSVVRDVAPGSYEPDSGDCVLALPYFVERAPSVTLRESVFERCYGQGVYLAEGALDMNGVVVRDIAPYATDQNFGRGVTVMGNDAAPASLRMRQSLVSNTRDSGVALFGVTAHLEGVRIVGADADGLGRYGFGIGAVSNGTTSLLTVRSSQVEATRHAGVMTFDTEVELLATSILQSATLDDGSWGDGVSILRSSSDSTAKLAGLVIASAERAGISAIDAPIALRTTRLDCNTLHLNAETPNGGNAGYINSGGNSCGCGDAAEACKVLSSELAAPAPPASGEKDGYGL